MAAVTVGERLRALRDSVKLSQLKLGKIAGLRQAAVNRYEHNQCEPPFRILLWYAEYFNVSMDYIFGRCSNPQGRTYNAIPKGSSAEMEQFVEMCFDPKAPMNGRLKETLLQMLKEGQQNE
jgi:transcriptional regulator with XRE-family HTH domain